MKTKRRNEEITEVTGSGSRRKQFAG